MRDIRYLWTFTLIYITTVSEIRMRTLRCTAHHLKHIPMLNDLSVFKTEDFNHCSARSILAQCPLEMHDRDIAIDNDPANFEFRIGIAEQTFQLHDGGFAPIGDVRVVLDKIKCNITLISGTHFTFLIQRPHERYHRDTIRGSQVSSRSVGGPSYGPMQCDSANKGKAVQPKFHRNSCYVGVRCMN
ncbi:hypothetical protein EV582_0238 [Duganella sp. BK701]|nr:hypothetical protein EV582_0238 [Duganella sp. BK701]